MRVLADLAGVYGDGLVRGEAWKDHRQELRENIDQILRGYDVLEARLLGGEAPKGEDVPAEAARFFANNTDPVHGGLGGTPKFPNPSCHDLLLRVYHRTRERPLLPAPELTLDCMAAGGIYDHVGGGFARYSVDERWAVPHFEKMLYDNGQLVKLYADAYRVTGKRSWRHVFGETITCVLRDMAHPEGGFCASEALSLGMIADYMDSLTTYGAGFYRNLSWEAGMVGQVLYLEAEEAGIRSTGIGCYFDDPVHEVFGIASRGQSVYHFAVGGPVDDVRLTTLPAYG